MLTARRRLTADLGRQRGLSLVELMVGIAIGLFVVAAAAMLLSTQLNDNRRLLLETQVNQDLRAAMDIVTRDLRRTGHWPLAHRSIWSSTTAQEQNPYLNVAPVNAASTQVDYRYRRESGEDGPFGYKRDGSVLKSLFSGAGWQELTDPKAVHITAFSVTSDNGPELKLPCPKLCPDGTEDCWPTLTVRELIVDVTGQAASDPSVQRSLSTRVRLRNDWLRFKQPNPDPALAADPAKNVACPP